MPLLFRRKSTGAATDSADSAASAGAGGGAAASEAENVDARHAPRGYTPSKKERGVTTPKRPSAHLRRPDTVAQPTSRKQLTKEERQQLRAQKRERRQEITDGMKRGDERYLSARDRGPERAIARDVVDSRRTVGTWFFAGALLVLFLSGAAMPPQVRLYANLAWAVLALAVILDSWLLCRRTGKRVRARHPDSTERRAALYFYVVMRGLTFRKLRIPNPRVGFGDPV